MDTNEDIFSGGEDWAKVTEPKATANQRHALYRLGLARNVVQKLTVTEADAAIKSMVALRRTLTPQKAKPDPEPPIDLCDRLPWADDQNPLDM